MGHLRGFGRLPLGVIVHAVTARILRVIFHEVIEIIDRDVLLSGQLDDNYVPRLNPLVLFAELAEVRRGLAPGRTGGPDQFCRGGPLTNDLDELRELLPVLLLGRIPAVQADVEMDGGKLVVAH